MRGRRSDSGERSGACACSSARASSAADGGLAAGLEAGEVLGQRLGQHAAHRGGVLDRRDLGVGRPAALELGHHQAAVGAEPEHRDAVTGGATGRRHAVELEGHDLDGRSEDGRVRQDPLLQIGALLQTRLFQRDHLRWHRDGPSDGEEHFFRHFSGQATANGCFSQVPKVTRRHNGITKLVARPIADPPVTMRLSPHVARLRRGRTRCPSPRRAPRHYLVGKSRALPKITGELCGSMCRRTAPTTDSDRALPARRAATDARARPREPGRGAVAQRVAAR